MLHLFLKPRLPVRLQETQSWKLPGVSICLAGSTVPRGSPACIPLRLCGGVQDISSGTVRYRSWLCVYIEGHALGSGWLGICSSILGLLALTLDYSETKMQPRESTNPRNQESSKPLSLMAPVLCARHCLPCNSGIYLAALWLVFRD